MIYSNCCMNAIQSVFKLQNKQKLLRLEILDIFLLPRILSLSTIFAQTVIVIDHRTQTGVSTPRPSQVSKRTVMLVR